MANKEMLDAMRLALRTLEDLLLVTKGDGSEIVHPTIEAVRAAIARTTEASASSRPCPFCGHPNAAPHPAWSFAMYCPECLALGPAWCLGPITRQQDAIDAWNDYPMLEEKIRARQH